MSKFSKVSKAIFLTFLSYLIFDRLYLLIVLLSHF